MLLPAAVTSFYRNDSNLLDRRDQDERALTKNSMFAAALAVERLFSLRTSYYAHNYIDHNNILL